MKLRKMRIGNWEFPVADETKILKRGLVEQGELLIKKWEKAFPEENTWTRQNLGVPSLIVRIDCVEQDGKLRIFEVEERPSGIGIASLLNWEFKERLTEVSGSWPDFKICLSKQRNGGGDHYLWREVIDISQAERSNDLLLLKSEPWEEEFWKLENRSVSSLKKKGDKSYGVKMGLWREARAGEELDWSRPFVLKPIQGSKCRDVVIWYPKRKAFKGIATKTKITATLERHSRMYSQPFIFPIKERDKWLMYRVFWGYDIDAKRWICLSGVYLISPSIKIHGTPETIIGALILE